MTKRNAIKALLGMASSALLAKSSSAQGTIGCAKKIPTSLLFGVGLDYSGCPPVKVTSTLHLSLSEEKTEKFDQSMHLSNGNGEIDGIEIHYQGQSKLITAKEIWEAIQ